ncbi:MAG TPA: glycosyltransferase [Acidimicrobiales bacterium]|nr:glycosyltransferase [Acidimicrobiales bacterium]
MRVVHVIGRMNVGGPAAIVTELATHLDVDLHVLVGDVGAGEADYLELRAPSLPVTRIPGLGRAVRPTDDVRALGGLVGELRRLRPDIVQTHTAKAGALGRTAAVVANVPARVHTFHGHLLHGYFSPRTTRAVVGAERALAVVTDRIVAVGEGVRDELVGARIGRRDQYVVIRPGVSLPNPPPARADARRALGLPVEGPIVAYVARLTGIKRPDRMIEVARALPDVTFVVAGDGPLHAEVRGNAPTNVHFLGWRADIENVYGAADVVLLTSDNEGMPVTLIEAALCGVPAVATNVGSTGEVVLDGRTGRTVAADAPALTDAVRRLLADDATREQMGDAARQWAEEAFGVRTMAEAHMRLYESLVADPPRRRLRLVRTGRRPSR